MEEKVRIVYTQGSSHCQRSHVLPPAPGTPLLLWTSTSTVQSGESPQKQNSCLDQSPQVTQVTGKEAPSTPAPLRSSSAFRPIIQGIHSKLPTS